MQFRPDLSDQTDSKEYKIQWSPVISNRLWTREKVPDNARKLIRENEVDVEFSELWS